MTNTFSIEFSDLSFEKQDEMVEEVAKSLLEEVKADGERLLERDWRTPKPESWQEAYVRYNSISHITWEEYENQEEGHDKPQLNNWIEWLADHLREEAEDRCYKALHHFEIEVTI